MAYMQSMTTEANMTGCQFPQYFYHLPGGNNGMYYGESITSPPPMVMAPPTSALNNNNGKADNYYTVISNRIFVGSLQTEVDEAILKQNFDNNGIIRESKIIRDNAGQSKGFGFITFQDEKDAAAVLEKPSGTYYFKGRTFNVASATTSFQTKMAYMQSMTTEANMTGCQFPQYFYHLPGGNNGMYYGESITSPPPMVMAPPTSALNNNNGKADNYYTVISNRIFVGSLQTEMAYMQSMTTEANMTGCQFPQYFYHPPGGDNGMYYGESITSPPPMVMAPPTSALNNNNGKADNYYTVISNRIFVGSLQTEVDEAILKQNFDNDGIIRESKIIRDNAGQSKGFGFITFQDEKDAAAVLEKPSGTYCFKGRTWNVAPAMRRFNNAPREAPIPAPNLYYYSNYPGGLVRYANGMVAYPNFVPQQIYNSPSPYVNSPMLPHQFVFPPVQPHYDPNCVPAIGPVNTGVTHQLQCVQLPNDNELSSTQPSSSMPSVASETSPSVNPDDFPPLPSKGSSSERGDVRPVPNTADPAPWQSFRSKM